MTHRVGALPQWSCRPPAEMREALETIRGILKQNKTGVVNYLLALGIESFMATQREREEIRRSGLTIGAILPFLEYGGDPSDKDQVKAAEEYFRKYHTGGIRHRVS